VQHKQFNFVRDRAKAASVTLLLMVAQPVLAGSIAQSSGLDPLLDGGPTVPCAAGVDYAPAIDVNGRAVVPADAATGRVPVPNAVVIPLGARASQAAGTGGGQATGNQPANLQTQGSKGAYVVLDGRKLEPLLNPPPCSASR
jgi:hypothetical protein